MDQSECILISPMVQHTLNTFSTYSYTMYVLCIPSLSFTDALYNVCIVYSLSLFLSKAVGSSPVGPVWAGPTFGAWWVW